VRACAGNLPRGTPMISACISTRSSNPSSSRFSALPPCPCPFGCADINPPANMFPLGDWRVRLEHVHGSCLIPTLFLETEQGISRWLLLVSSHRGHSFRARAAGQVAAPALLETLELPTLRLTAWKQCWSVSGEHR